MGWEHSESAILDGLSATRKLFKTGFAICLLSQAETLKLAPMGPWPPEVFHSKNSPPCDKQPLLKISVVEYSPYEPAITRGVSTQRGAPPFSRSLREGGNFDSHCPGKAA